MFAFRDASRPYRRLGLSAAVILLSIAGVATMAALGHRERPSAPTPAAGELIPDPGSCTPGTMRLADVSGGPVDPRALFDAMLQHDATVCGYLTAHDPARDGFPITPAARSEARVINAGVEAAVCPDRSTCPKPRYGTATDVALIRGTLLRLGYAGAEVRLAKHVGESPEFDVVYGVPLRAAAGCLVSFARMGLGVAPMGPVGTLRDGRCLQSVD